MGAPSRVLICLIVLHFGSCASLNMTFTPLEVVNGLSNGREPWSNPDWAKSDDTLSSDCTVFAGDAPDRLKAVNFGIMLPNGSTLQGIEMRSKRCFLGSGSAQDLEIFLGRPAQLSAASQLHPWATNTATCGYSQWSPWYGGSNDLWGITWTLDNILQLEVHIDAKADSLGTMFVNAIEVMVHYQLLPASSTTTTPTSSTAGTTGGILPTVEEEISTTTAPPTPPSTSDTSDASGTSDTSDASGTSDVPTVESTAITSTTTVVSPGKSESATESAGSPIAVIVGMVLASVVVLSIVGVAFFVWFIKRKGPGVVHPVDVPLSISIDRSRTSIDMKHAAMIKGIEIQETIGKGQFGVVYKGLWTTQPVALKCISGELLELHRELSILQKLSHPHIVQFFGIFEKESQFYIVMEFMNGGSLRELLCKIAPKLLPIRQLLNMCIGACSGMAYLEERGVIHRDLACRNLLVTKSDGQFVVKVSDFGMSVDSNYYKSDEVEAAIPVRWTAPEAIEKRRFTSKSDVWSYAVTCWEIFTYGNVPYPSLRNGEILDHVQTGGRLPQPAECPGETYSLWLKCWNMDPQQRPSFATLLAEMMAVQKDPMIKSDQPVLEDTMELYICV